MPDYHVFIDDSGSQGKILDFHFNKLPIQDPIQNTTGLNEAMAVGAIIVPDRYMYALNQDFLRLRNKIKRDLGIDYLPNLHMRHLWGKVNFRDKKKNPFWGLPQEQRLKYARWGYKLISEYCQSGRLLVAGYSNITLGMQDTYHTYYSSPEAQIESAYIYKHFKKSAQSFYTYVLNPIPALMGNILIDVDQFCQEKNHTACIYYDDSDSSKGFDQQDIFKALESINKLQTLKENKITDTNKTALLQLADLCSFRGYKKGLEDCRGAGDQEFKKLIEGLRFAPISVRQLETEDYHLATCIHYLMGIQHLQKLDPEWVNTHLYSPAEFYQKAMETDPDEPGINIIRPEIMKRLMGSV